MDRHRIITPVGSFRENQYFILIITYIKVLTTASKKLFTTREYPLGGNGRANYILASNPKPQIGQSARYYEKKRTWREAKFPYL